MSSGITYGQQENDTINDSFLIYADTTAVGPVKRIQYQGKEGVFLSTQQELVTLAKFILKNNYKLIADNNKKDAVFNWYLYLTEKNMHNDTKIDLDKTQKELKTVNTQLGIARDLNNKLTSEKKLAQNEAARYKKQRNESRAINFGLSLGLVFLVILK